MGMNDLRMNAVDEEGVQQPEAWMRRRSVGGLDCIGLDERCQR